MGRMRLSDLDSEARTKLGHLLDSVRYEVLPLRGAVRAAARLPAGSEVAVTSDPALGMDATIALSVELAGRGFEMVPHLSAQLTRDQEHLERQIEALSAAGIDRALVIGGAAEEPGEFFDAASLLEALEQMGSPLSAVGIGGYPEGHHILDDQRVEDAMLAKASRADWITTQICFDVPRLEEWLGRLPSSGAGRSIWLGVPAVADLTGLMSLGLKVGAGRSLQFMFEHPKLVGRLLRPGGAQATDLVLRLAALADREEQIAGFHLFTYNQTRAAERWRRGLARRATN